MLNRRQAEILHLLIKKQSFLSIKSLSKTLGVSQRTIQYDLSYIEYYAKNLNFEIMRHKNVGVKVERINKDILKQIKSDISIQFHYSKQERILSIILKLFESSTPISSKQLSELFHVSRRTIVDDIKIIQSTLSEHNLNLNYVQNKGFNIIGNEEHYRKVYAYYVKKYLRQNIPLVSLDLFSTETLSKVRSIIIETLQLENYPLVQSAIDGLIYHVSIAMQRVKENFSFEIPKQEIKKLSNTNQYYIASQIKKNLEKSFDITFPQTEIIFITLHLMGSRIIEDTNQVTEPSETYIFNKSIKKFVTAVSAELGIESKQDNKLFNSLSIHMKPAINRLKFNIHQKNPLKREIYNKYKHIVKAINKHIYIFEELYKISFTSDELAYITIHFISSIERESSFKEPLIKVVLLCGSGIGTSQLLRSKLSNLYPEFYISDAYSIYQIDENQLLQDDIDYIISTVPCTIHNIPVILVDPFINKDSRNKLNKIINSAREKRVANINKFGKSLKDLLPLHRIIKNKNKLNRDQAIQFAVQPLVDDEIVNDNYASDIKLQFSKFGAYMVISPHIALIHADSKNVLHGAGFAITYFEEGIIFEHKLNDPVYLVITLATSNPKIHLKALEQLSKLLTHKTKKNAFLNGNISKIKTYVKEIVNNKEV